MSKQYYKKKSNKSPKLSNHKQLRAGDRPLNANNPGLSIKEDYRKGSYYIKHAHSLDMKHKVYFVFKDNPNTNNWRGDQNLFKSIDDIDEAIKWIQNRRCFQFQ